MSAELDQEALSIIEKVKKLLALAGNNDNEHQASAATAKAMELLAAYNLDMGVVNSASSSARKDNRLKGGLYKWQRDLWEAISRLNFCMYWPIKGLARGSSYEHRILGRHENVIGAQVMADYLQGTVERLAKEWANDEGFHSVFVKQAIAYREGIAERLVERLNALRNERLAEDRKKEAEAKARATHPAYASSGTSLVLSSVIQSEDDLNNDYIEGLEPGTTSQRRAEARARRDAVIVAADAALALRDAQEAADPTLRAARLAAEAAEQARIDKYWADLKPRYRAETPREARRRMASFGHGYEEGNNIGLDKQIDRNSRKELT